jgi:hypothetical protein
MKLVIEIPRKLKKCKNANTPDIKKKKILKYFLKNTLHVFSYLKTIISKTANNKKKEDLTILALIMKKRIKINSEVIKINKFLFVNTRINRNSTSSKIGAKIIAKINFS